jgi:hypothetical protein
MAQENQGNPNRDSQQNQGSSQGTRQGQQNQGSAQQGSGQQNQTQGSRQGQQNQGSRQRGQKGQASEKGRQPSMDEDDDSETRSGQGGNPNRGGQNSGNR